MWDSFFDMIASLMEFLFKITMPIVLFVAFLVIVKIIYRYVKYGYREFDIFKKRSKRNEPVELLFMMLEKNSEVQKIIKPKKLYSHLVVISPRGIYLFLYCSCNGLIEGNVSNKTLAMHYENEVISIDNPFVQVKVDAQKLGELIEGVPIYERVIINNVCLFNVKGYQEENLIRMKHFFYKQERERKNRQKRYVKDDINRIYQKIYKVI